MLAGSSSTPGSTYWWSMPDTPPVRHMRHCDEKGFGLVCKSSSGRGGTDLSTGSTVMPPPGESELTGTDHAHGGSQVWDPDRSL